MCYYNGTRVSREDFIRLKQLEKAASAINLYRPMQSGFDYSDYPVIKPTSNCDWEITTMEWGFLPDKWFGKEIDTRAKAERFRKGFPNLSGKMEPGITTLNAMAEELLLPGKIYRESALQRRCLIFSSGFYEWRHVYRTNKKTGLPLKTPDKYPYHIRVKDAKYFFMAGIWKPWTDKETGETVDTFSLVTTKANKLMEQVHNSKMRMPTILMEELAGEWISDGLSEERITELATNQLPAEQMEAYTIQKDFRTAEDAALKHQYQELPELVL